MYATKNVMSCHVTCSALHLSSRPINISQS